MMFMLDSERAASIAKERGIDAGLHLNLTTPFSAPLTTTRLVVHQQRLARYLSGHRLAQVLYHPRLSGSFEYVVAAQIAEFARLYRAEASRIDGHHHMHLCSNIVFGRLLPVGTIVRRNFSFQPGEKSLCNRLYRRIIDHMLARRHYLADFFFSLNRFKPRSRILEISGLAHRSTVEVATHAIDADEFCFLTGTDLLRWASDDLPLAPRFPLPTTRTFSKSRKADDARIPRKMTRKKWGHLHS